MLHIYILFLSVNISKLNGKQYKNMGLIKLHIYILIGNIRVSYIVSFRYSKKNPCPNGRPGHFQKRAVLGGARDL